MANLADRLPQNVPGRFYVDAQCIDCDLCRETAPNVFARHDESGFSYVYRQPLTPEDMALAEEALQGCPVEAIGHDGGESGEPAQQSSSNAVTEDSRSSPSAARE